MLASIFVGIGYICAERMVKAFGIGVIVGNVIGTNIYLVVVTI